MSSGTKLQAGEEARQILRSMEVVVPEGRDTITLTSPIDESPMPSVPVSRAADVNEAIAAAQAAFRTWRNVPAPVRGELVRLFGQQLRTHKNALGRLVTLEVGKTLSEGVGEVQEMIDICDFAVGLSRQLHGLTIVSERPEHHMREMWQPLGPVGVITAFNFPVAVWSWNAALALVCGNPVLWKPSEKTPLVAWATHQLLSRTVQEFSAAPAGLMALLIGGGDIGRQLVTDSRIPLISATGSTRMGRSVGTAVAERFGRSLLELGGNAATIVTPSANIELAVRAIAFGATGTTGQRCTTMRRLIVHEDVYEKTLNAVKRAYTKLQIGDPRDARTHVGPLIDKAACESMHTTLAEAREDGGKVTGGAKVDRKGYYVQPALVEMPTQTEVVKRETFAPILYVLKYRDFDDALHMLQDVPQGLSSSIITTHLREAELFLSARGSDCGIANVNMGTSGAEIGGAFGGEKETGGGRESGSDAWKAYMRRQTQTINYGLSLPLAQGVEFDV
ncbi:MAG TPA: aldehyde dehydrogenase family protein [Steroidobacteraceae bacterium]|nr:aldehyde dehydrogenase family protein [Steroidobacteraceae bacterium]